MFNKQLTQYQLFIKNPTAKSALQKSFLPCKIKIKSVLKIMRQPPVLVSQNSCSHKIIIMIIIIIIIISKILERHPRRNPLLPEQQKYSLQLYRKWFPHGSSPSIPKMNDYFKEKTPNIPFTIKVKILSTKFFIYLQVKTLL